MKDIISKINENESLSALYLKNEDVDTWTISNKGKDIKDIGRIEIASDPYAGIYFIGSTDKLKMLQKVIKEETIIEENAF